MLVIKPPPSRINTRERLSWMRTLTEMQEQLRRSLIYITMQKAKIHQNRPMSGSKLEIDIFVNKTTYLRSNRWSILNFMVTAETNLSDRYSQALDSSPAKKEEQTIKLNRSLAHIQLGLFDAALEDLGDIPKAHKLYEKALYRKALALYSLSRYQETWNVLALCCNEYSNNEAAKALLIRTIARVKELTSGKYAFAKMQLQVSKSLRAPSDHATHVGAIAMRSTKCWGRGLFTTKEIKVGDLLFCERAFEYLCLHADEIKKTRPPTNSAIISAERELSSRIFQKVSQNPSLTPSIINLHPGIESPTRVVDRINHSTMDRSLAQRITFLNCFGSPLSAQNCHKNQIPGHFLCWELESCGLWPTASLLNHSCYPNAWRSFIGDMMILRAIRDIPRHTELTVFYVQPVDDCRTKDRDFQHWGFACSCIICQDIRDTKKTTIKERKLLKDSLWWYLNTSRVPDGERVKREIGKLERTYLKPSSKVPRLSIWRFHLALTEIYVLQAKPIKVISSALSCLESLGYVILGGRLPLVPGTPIIVKEWGLLYDNLVRCWMVLSYAYNAVAPDLELQARKYAKLTYKICVGEDETFEETYGNGGAQSEAQAHMKVSVS
ncbi:TPR domain protein [Penicillium macrosclerotiorum]|uniref:TPR domain protein n=1 Tax=Penicillium macrosclerotiorum TaxID=303699 RepID=UPI0025475029|nr:TPR domain protein [Penicillium macrosclerotiorum]KAJ5692599.1 TPR domain protein [Penicillium macrosclerotiorum]